MKTTQGPFLVQTDTVISEKKIRFTDGHQRTQGKNPLTYYIQVTDKLNHITKKGHQTHALVVISTDCISRHISNYQLNTTMEGPFLFFTRLCGLGLWCLTPLSTISWQSVLLVEETGVPWENQLPAASNKTVWQVMIKTKPYLLSLFLHRHIQQSQNTMAF